MSRDELIRSLQQIPEDCEVFIEARDDLIPVVDVKPRIARLGIVLTPDRPLDEDWNE